MRIMRRRGCGTSNDDIWVKIMNAWNDEHERGVQ